MTLLTSLTLALLLVVGVAVAGLLIAGGRSSRGTGPLAQVGGRIAVATAAVLGLAVLAGTAGRAVPVAGDVLGVVAPLAAATIGVGSFAIGPWRDDRAPGRRRASLVPRTSGSVLRRRALLAPIGVTAALVAGLAWTTSVAAPDQRSFVLRGPHYEAVVDGFPGWLSAGPVLGGVVLLTVATVAAARRLLLLPPITEDAGRDAAWRRSALGVLLSLVTVALLMQTATITSAVATSTGIIARAVEPNGYTPAPWFGVVAGVAGAAVPIIGLTWLALLVATVVRAVLLTRSHREAVVTA